MGLFGLFGLLFENTATPVDDNDCDWYCDDCGAFMNEQSGFTTASDIWTCSECGSTNDVSEDNIVFDDEEEEFYALQDDTFYDDEDDDDDCGDRLSLSDAADIFGSRGCDEDYMFGYTRKELERALKG